jgi:predicted nucleic acid-binding protein
MSERQGIVLDANILLRAALGRRVRHILRKFEDQASFYSADVCFHDARKYIVAISEKQSLDPGLGLSVLAEMSQLVEQVPNELYAKYEAQARARIQIRDPDDWPVVAVALLLELPI